MMAPLFAVKTTSCTFTTDKIDLAQAFLDVLNSVISGGEFYAYASAAYPGLTDWSAMVTSCFGTAI